MVAKINIGSSLFGALSYNRNKVEEGEAKVISSNKMPESEDGMFNIQTCMNFFNYHLPQDIKTEKPVIHISLNPHPDDVLTDEQMKDIAQIYMEKMGYGSQPYIVFKHEDIERHHIHIVSLRVDESGKKLDDSNNFYKSKEITRELEKKYNLHSAEKKKRTETSDLKKVCVSKGNLKIQIGNVIKPLISKYHFQSLNEYRSLLSLYNVHVEEVKGEVKGRKYNGLVYSALDDRGNKTGNPFKSSLYGKSVGYDALYSKFNITKDEIKKKNFKVSTREKVLNALKMASGKSDFENILSQNNINVLFRENESGRIYGTTFIDHENKCVFNGSRLGKDLSANALELHFNHDINPSNNNNKESFENEHESEYSINKCSSFTDTLSMFQFESAGTDPEEERFRRLMQRRKKRKRRIK